jgi:hypothetical protein
MHKLRLQYPETSWHVACHAALLADIALEKLPLRCHCTALKLASRADHN